MLPTAISTIVHICHCAALQSSRAAITCCPLCLSLCQNLHVPVMILCLWPVWSVSAPVNHLAILTLTALAASSLPAPRLAASLCLWHRLRSRCTSSCSFLIFSSEIPFFFCIVVDIMIKMWLPWAWKCTGSTEANTEALPVWVCLTILKLPCNDEKMFQLSFHWLALLSFAMPVSSIASFDLSKSSAESWRLLQLCDVKIAKCNMSI